MDKIQLELIVQLFQKLQNEISVVKATNQLLIKRLALKEDESLEELQRLIESTVKTQIEFDQKKFYDFLEKISTEQHKDRLFPLK